MEITVSEFGDAAKKVVLTGKLDIKGAEKIDLPLAAVAGSRTNILIDMNGVDYIASIGIRHLVSAAKTTLRASRKLILLNPNPMVAEVLVTSGLNDLLPIVRSEDEARTAFAPGAV